MSTVIFSQLEASTTVEVSVRSAVPLAFRALRRSENSSPSFEIFKKVNPTYLKMTPWLLRSLIHPKKRKQNRFITKEPGAQMLVEKAQIHRPLILPKAGQNRMVLRAFWNLSSMRRKWWWVFSSHERRVSTKFSYRFWWLLSERWQSICVTASDEVFKKVVARHITELLIASQSEFLWRGLFRYQKLDTLNGNRAATIDEALTECKVYRGRYISPGKVYQIALSLNSKKWELYRASSFIKPKSYRWRNWY